MTRKPWEASFPELLSRPNDPADVRPDNRGETPPRSARSVVQQPTRGEALQDAIRRFNADVDILELLAGQPGERGLKRVASTNGGEWAGPCPLCGGEDRLRVWPNADRPGAWCRRCEASGDALSWQVRIGGDDPQRRGATAETLRRLGLV